MRPLNFSITVIAYKLIRHFIIIICLIVIDPVTAQPYHFVESHSQDLHSSGKEISSAGWIFIYDTLNIYHHTFVDDYFSELGLSSNDSLNMEKVLLDEELSPDANSNLLHEYYKQYYKAILVEGAEFAVHSADSFVYLVHGKLIDSLNFNVTPSISSASALDSALIYVDAEVFAWESDTLEEIPTPLLLLAHLPGTPFHEDNYLLCYKITVNAEIPYSSNDIYINANTGEVEFVKSNIRNCNGENGTGVTNFYGTQDLEIRHRWLQDDFILENCGKNIWTKEFGDDYGTWSSQGNVTDADGDFTGSINAVTAHWAAGVTHEIYDNVFGLEGMCDDNGKVRIFVDHRNEENHGPHYFGESKIPRIFIGFLDEFNTLDVMAHEWTHGVTQRSSNLSHELEPGALNESFSDIFGKVIEWREATAWNLNGFNHPANPNISFDWLLGNDGGSPVRSMSDPGLFDQPDEYEGPFWVNTTNCIPTDNNDDCGAHTNSGVQNHWFFLLSVGGGSESNVSGIGIENTSRIAFRNLTVYMQENSNYLDARLGAVQAGKDLFGSCSEIDLQNQTAWSEVNIGEAGWCGNITGDGAGIGADEQICLANDPLAADEIGYFQVNAPYYASITWLNLSNSWTYTISGINNEYLTVTDWGNPGPHPPCILIGAELTLNTTVKRVYKEVCFKYCDIIDPRSVELSLSNSPKVEIYPNPTKDVLFINSEYDKARFTIWNAVGNEILNDRISLGENQYSLVNVSSGLYFIRILDNSGTPISNEILLINEKY